mmetsp:Transcript_58776/g.172009  ORF Transcript_58776/g.172009 Transcript_58776/m.172009 type:complete len:204 (-) Transcript_58776:1029-1640(-)
MQQGSKADLSEAHQKRTQGAPNFGSGLRCTQARWQFCARCVAALACERLVGLPRAKMAEAARRAQSASALGVRIIARAARAQGVLGGPPGRQALLLGDAVVVAVALRHPLPRELAGLARPGGLSGAGGALRGGAAAGPLVLFVGVQEALALALALHSMHSLSAPCTLKHRPLSTSAVAQGARCTWWCGAPAGLSPHRCCAGLG